MARRSDNPQYYHHRSCNGFHPVRGPSPEKYGLICDWACGHTRVGCVVWTYYVTVWLFQMTGACRAYSLPVTTTYWGWCLIRWARDRTSCWQATVKSWQLWLRWVSNAPCSLLSEELPLRSLDDSVSWTLPICKLRFVKILVIFAGFKGHCQC